MKKLLFFLGIFLFNFSFLNAQTDELPTIQHVDIQKYMGKWYEIASFPQWYQKNCTGTVAEYTLMKNGKVKVVNSCHLNSLNGKLKTANGTAYVDDETTNAKLLVTFFWPFYGDYWILDLGKNYEYAIVGTPDRKSLWFLSRTPQISTKLLNQLKEKAKSLGFDISKLQMTAQP